MKICILLDEE